MKKCPACGSTKYKNGKCSKCNFINKPIKNEKQEDRGSVETDKK